ncbi:hypothetical protein Ancab_013625 [Ancistrocladus abbreviatus]
MYPKVKVRDVQDQDDSQQKKQGRSLQKLKAFDTLSIRAFSSAVKEHKLISPASVVKVPTSVTPSSDTRGSGKVKKETEADDKPRIRASSAPRPRAVLSSPDNDEMIGSRMKSRRERPSALKDHDQIQSRNAKCKATPTNAFGRNLMERLAAPSEAVSKSDAEGNKGLTMAVRNQRAKISNPRPSLKRI